jgi:cytochrome c oxidase cbb3-type subunit 3
MKARILAGAALLVLATGCNQMPGTPKPGIEVPRPDSVTDFKTLYSENCAGCHGRGGQNGAALNLANPLYQAWVDDATLRKIISSGEPGTQMPAFGQQAGGLLTAAQVDALVHGMRTAWLTAGTPGGPTPPPYQATKSGDATRGQAVYQTACSRCHEDPRHKITDSTYLALVNDQTLRTIVIAGRSDLGHPDWRSDIEGHPLTDDEVTDVVAWLASLRSQTPGQPYPSQPAPGSAQPGPQNQ